MLSLRILSAIVFFVLFFVGLFQPAFFWIVPLLVVFASLSALREFMRFGALRPRPAYFFFAAAASLALLADAYWSPSHLQFTFLVLGSLTLLSLSWGTLTLDPNFTESAGKSVIGTLYTALPLALILLIWRKAVYSHGCQDGQHYVIFLVLVTQATDIGAYFTGRLIGRHKLAPRLSPGKTVEGAVGGLLFTVLVAVCFKLFWNNMDRIFPHWWEVIALGAIFSIVGPIGDLAESWLKRNAGMKDSGHLIAGHGGMLDVIDSLLFTTIFYYGYLWLFHPEIL